MASSLNITDRVGVGVAASCTNAAAVMDAAYSGIEEWRTSYAGQHKLQRRARLKSLYLGIMTRILRRLWSSFRQFILVQDDHKLQEEEKRVKEPLCGSVARGKVRRERFEGRHGEGVCMVGESFSMMLRLNASKVEKRRESEDV